MAPPPSLRKIAKDAISGAPGWIDGLLQPLSIFMGQIQDALTNQLTVKENLAQCWVVFTANSGDTVQPFALPNLKGRAPFGVSVEGFVPLVGGDSVTSVPSVVWDTIPVNGRPGLRIRTIHNFPSGVRATFTLLVKAE